MYNMNLALWWRVDTKEIDYIAELRFIFVFRVFNKTTIRKQTIININYS